MSDVITAASMFVDEPTTFTFNKQLYEPANYHDDYHGNVTVRDALAKSMNIPTIKAAEQIGYEKVAKCGSRRRCAFAGDGNAIAGAAAHMK